MANSSDAPAGISTPKGEFAPLLTVVCITYNQEKFIRDALDSFLAQKTDFPFEVLVADDASTDDTPNILKEYEKKHGHIIKVIYRKDNLGAMKNYLATLSQVHSQYVIYNEGDDYFSDPHKLQKQVGFLETHPDYAVCFHPVRFHYEDGSLPDGVFPKPEERFNKTKLSLKDLLIQNFMSTNSVMYRWRFVEENLLDVFSPSILPGDYYLHLLHAQKGEIGFIDEEMSVYRRHAESIWWDSLNPEKLHIRYCNEIFGFYYAVYENITGCDKAYYTTALTSVFDTLVTSLRKHDRMGNLKGVFEKHPEFAVERYAELAGAYEKLREQKERKSIKKRVKDSKIGCWLYVKYKKIGKS